MPEYTLLCRRCANQFEHFSWDDLEEDSRACPRCGSTDTAVQWAIELPNESLRNFACGCGGG